MKKVVLVLVCVLIMTVFVAFNYLLWDREKFMNVDANKNATIDLLTKQIKALNDENQLQKSKSYDYEFEIKRLKDEVTKITQEKDKTLLIVDQKNEVINVLKKSADLSQLEDIIKKWTDSINNVQYEAAYNFLGKMDKPQTLTDFTTNYKGSIKSIKILSIKLFADNIYDDKKGDIIFKVNMEVKRTEGENKWNFYYEGANEKYFYFVFDKDKKTWVINNIANLY